MKFWALAYQYQEDVYWDFESNGDTMDLTETCFLPTESVAKGVIENQLSSDYVAVEISLERLEKNGIWSYTRSRVDRWDEEF